MKNILILHGPNLNLLGERETEIYGNLTLDEINKKLEAEAKVLAVTVKIAQYNSEGDIIDRLHNERKWADGVVINPAAYTHYSYAIRDAVACLQCPVIEVHLSDISKREPFRQVSVIKDVCVNQISGLGWKSYLTAMQELVVNAKPR